VERWVGGVQGGVQVITPKSGIDRMEWGNDPAGRAKAALAASGMHSATKLDL